MKRTIEAFEQYLVTQSVMSEEHVQKARSDAEHSKTSFKKACLKLGFVTEEAYALAESSFLEIPFANFDDYIIEPDVLKLVPQGMAKQYGIFPLFRVGKTLTLAVHDPHNIFVIDQLRDLTKLDIELLLSTETDILNAVREHYGALGLEDAAKDAQKKIQQKNAAIAGGKPKPEGIRLDLKEEFGAANNDAPVIKLVDQTLLQALEDKASDIHIEPEAEFVRIRNRIDGVLIEVAQLPKSLQNPLISRIKIMSKLDIAETRKPQDGKIRLTTAGKDIDIRVSSFPTVHGENIVLRILDRSNTVLDLVKLGFKGDILAKFKTVVAKPYGIVLVTGPTGSGKTTTLYAALQSINTVDKNIVTVEDPIEYQMPMIRQTQVNPKAGLTFAVGLRSLLRQDPDVMLVGEIRDTETAEVAAESALTGHLVFSTLHTNDAPGATTRLIDMGIEPFLIASSLVGVLAQRLVRTICSGCKKERSLRDLHLKKADEDALIEMHRKNGGKGEPPIYAGEGCKLCKRTGYKGRMAIFELMVVDDEIRRAIARRAPSSEIRKMCFNEKNPSLKLYGFQKILEGHTTVEEVLKVVQDE